MEKIEKSSELFKRQENGKPIQKLSSTEGVNVQNYNQYLCLVNQFVIEEKILPAVSRIKTKNVDIHKLELLCQQKPQSQDNEGESNYNLQNDEAHKKYLDQFSTKKNQAITETFTESQNLLSKCLRLKQELGLNFQQNQDDQSVYSSSQSQKSTPQQLIKKLTIE